MVTEINAPPTPRDVGADWQDRRPSLIAPRWAGQALLSLGVGHLLAAVVFFFAFNWATMAPVTKFGLIGGGLTAAVALFSLRPPRDLAGHMGALIATVLTGVLFAVIGQVYQTGADAWQLFALWAILTVPFLATSRHAAHWLIWAIIAFIAATSFAGQYAIPLDWISRHGALTLIGALGVGGLLTALIIPYLMPRTASTAPIWLLCLLALAPLGYLGVVAWGLIWSFDRHGDALSSWLGAGGFVVLATGLAWLFRHDRHRFALSSLGGAALAILLGSIAARFIFDQTILSSIDEILPSMIAMTLCGLALVIFYASWMRRQWARIASDAPALAPDRPGLKTNET
ncbi:MAG: DUF2157 domain-containing protein, partial [Pseudomonadota bacterium]